MGIKRQSIFSRFNRINSGERLIEVGNSEKGESVALTQCLQCSGTFDESAQFCPGCGFPVPIQAVKDSSQETNSEPTAANVEPTVELPPEGSNANNLYFALAVFAGMVAIGLCMGGTDSSSRIANVDDGKSWAITMAQAFVKERLKSPSSASFPWSYDEYRATKGIGGEWSVSGYVDAVNGFNANLRTHWSVQMSDEGANWRLLSIDIRE